MTRQFRKFFKYRKGKLAGKKKYSSGKRNTSFSNANSNKNQKSDEIVICYRCNKVGHMKGECPEKKKEKHKKLHKFKKPKAMVATWSDEDSSEKEEEEKSSSSKSEEICFMANSSDGKDDFIVDSSPTVEELEDIGENLNINSPSSSGS
ncbi:hypothetical protein Taro_046242, partial [Colocasia esculenta]|nr:hypothetical protein [Colocasia esculenta]